MSRFADSPRQAWLAAGAAGAFVAIAAIAFGPSLLRTGGPVAANRSGDEAATASERESEPSLDDLELIDRTRQRVRADLGGSVVGPGGFGRVDLPAGALPEDIDVEIARFAVDHPQDPAGFAIDLRPDGLRLARTGTVELPLPPGLEAGDVEIVIFDPRRESWTPEPVQRASSDGASLVAEITHFSLRRIRIRPGMRFPYDPDAGRGTFYLEADAGNTFESYVDGRWQAVGRRSPEYRKLMQLHRTGRHELIVSGRLRALTAARPRPEVFRDHRRTVAMPPGVPEARTGWVRITRLRSDGTATDQSVVARVNDFGPGPAARRVGVVVDMSRATMEALGLSWSKDFGLSRGNPNLAWIRYRPPGAPSALRHVPVRVEAYDPQPPRAYACRLW